MVRITRVKDRVLFKSWSTDSCRTLDFQMQNSLSSHVLPLRVEPLSFEQGASYRFGAKAARH